MSTETHLTKIVVFKGKQVRKTIHNNEWWFVIEDVVSVLTDSVQPSGYIKDMRRRDPELSRGWGQIATPFWSKQPVGRKRSTVPIQKASSALSSRFPLPKLNRSSVGWRKLVMSVSRK